MGKISFAIKCNNRTKEKNCSNPIKNEKKNKSGECSFICSLAVFVGVVVVMLIGVYKIVLNSIFLYYKLIRYALNKKIKRKELNS